MSTINKNRYVRRARIVREKAVEKRLTDEAKKIGCMVVKLSCDGTNGMPDRLIIMPNGKVIFIETKRPKNGRVSSLQDYTIKKLRQLGHRAYVINTIELVSIIVKELNKELGI